MNAVYARTNYLFCSNEAEYGRLMRQAQTLAPHTKRLFHDAGIARGQRVLDVGSGVDDVSLLAASLVGETGSLFGMDRDAVTLDPAATRRSLTTRLRPGGVIVFHKTPLVGLVGAWARKAS